MSRMLYYIGYTINKFELLLSIPTWPLISPFWTRRIYNKAKAILLKYDIDTVVPIYTQIDTLIATSKLKQSFPEIKYIAYFLDSLSGGYGPKYFSKKWTMRRGFQWERKVLKNADLVVMMDSAKNHYHKYCHTESYFKKTIFLDLPLFSPKSDLGEKQESDNPELVNIIYVGSIHIPIRNPEYFLKLFCQLPDKNLRLHIVGPNNCYNIMRYYSSIDDRIIVKSSVSHIEAEQLISSADILLNFGNSCPNMTPSKIFEYMSYGKPIISTAPIEDEPCIKYLCQYPLTLIISEKEELIEENTKMVIHFISNHQHSICDSKSLMDIFHNNTPQALYQSIAKLQDVEIY